MSAHTNDREQLRHLLVMAQRPRERPTEYRICANNAVAPADLLNFEEGKDALPYCPDCVRLLLVEAIAARQRS